MRTDILKIIKNNCSLLITAGFLILCAVYVFIYGENIYAPRFDTLDDWLLRYKLLSDNNLFWNNSGIAPFLNGLDRKYLFSDLKAVSWLFMIFPNFTAYIILLFLKVITAVSGFLFLGKTADKNYKQHVNIILFCGFLYGIIPCFQGESLSFSSLPFLIGLLIMFFRKPELKTALLLFIYPLFSSFVHFGVFIIFYLLLAAAAFRILKGRFKLRILAAALILLSGYMITEYNILLSFFTAEETVRTSWRAPHYYYHFENLVMLKNFLASFIIGHHMAGGMQGLVVFPVCIIYFTLKNLDYIRKQNFKGMLFDYYNWIFAALIINSFIFCLYYSSFTDYLWQIIPQIRGYNYSRIIWSSPFLWYSAFAAALINFPKFKYSSILKCIICSFAASILLFTKPSSHAKLTMIRENIDMLYCALKGCPQKELTYAQFYSKSLFDKIKKDINYSGERSCAFGFFPAVLEYNKIYTIDGYMSYFPLKYKKQFTALIKPELESISPEAAQDFYTNIWGGEIYLSPRILYNPEITHADININGKIFKDMGGVYIFSRVIIDNYKEKNLEFVSEYTDENSPYTVYLYKINGG